MSSFARQLFRPLSPISQCKILRAQSSVNRNFKVYPTTYHQSRCYHLHPEQLMHIYKAKEVYKVCNYIDSEKYKKFLQSLGKEDNCYIDKINSNVKHEMKKYLNTNATQKNQSNSETVDNFDKYNSGKKKNGALKNIFPSLLKKKHNDTKLGSSNSRTYSVAADNYYEHKKTNYKKNTVLPIVLEKRNNVFKLEKELKRNHNKSMSDIVKRLQKIRKLEKIKNNLKMLESLKPKIQGTKSMSGLLDADILKTLQPKSKVQRLDNVATNMSPSNQLSVDNLSLSHKSILDVNRNSSLSVKSSPSIRRFHDATNVNLNADNKSIYSMNSMESLSIIEDLKERARKNNDYPNFNSAIAKQVKLNDIKKQSLVLGANTPHPFSLFQKIKLATTSDPPKVAVKILSKRKNHLDELCRTKKYTNLTNLKKEDIPFKNPKEESVNKSIKSITNPLLNNNCFRYYIH